MLIRWNSPMHMRKTRVYSLRPGYRATSCIYTVLFMALFARRLVLQSFHKQEKKWPVDKVHLKAINTHFWVKFYLAELLL